MNFAGFRVVCAVILGFAAAAAIPANINMEHHKVGMKRVFSDKPASKEVSAMGAMRLYIPIMGIGVLTVIALKGSLNGLQLAGTLVDIMLLLCVYFAVLLCVLPLLRRKISPMACATLWVAPLFMTIYGFFITKSSYMPLLTVYIPRRALLIALGVWLTGTAVVLAWYVADHLRFRKGVLRFSEEVTDGESKMLFESLREEMEFYRPVKLLRSAAVTAPFSMGWMRRTKFTVLPERDYSP